MSDTEIAIAALVLALLLLIVFRVWRLLRSKLPSPGDDVASASPERSKNQNVSVSTDHGND